MVEEWWYDFVSRMYSIAVFTTGAYCYACFCKGFLHSKRCACALGIVYGTVMLILNFMPYYIDKVLAYGIGTICGFLVMCALDRRNYYQKIFLAVTFFCLRWQAAFFIDSVSGIYWKFLYNLRAASSPGFWFIAFVLDTALGWILYLFLLYQAVSLLLKSYRRKEEHLEGKELVILSMPSLLGMLTYMVLMYWENIYLETTGRNFDYMNTKYNLLTLVYSIFSYLVIWVVVYLFFTWKEEREEEKQKAVTLKSMESLESHVRQVEQLYQNIRSLKHDMGNHMMTLQSLYGKGEYEAAEKYIEEMGAQMADAALDIKSGNPVTDVILSEKKKEAEEKGIAFFADFHYPEDWNMNAFDISTILNNGLVNAIEAIEREKSDNPWIAVSSARVKRMYVIEIANSFHGELVMDKESGRPATSKNGDGHGFGLLSITKAVQKYYGGMELKTEEREKGRCCVLCVMLQEPEETA